MPSEFPLDTIAGDEAALALARCCGATRWVSGMLARRPFGSFSALERAAHEVWAGLGPDDYREAFAHHPAIGADAAALRAKFAPTAEWSHAEQAGTRSADALTLEELAAKNRAYRERFGFVFLICATGKSAAEMLDALRARLDNPPERELALAALEQDKITALRLAKLVASLEPASGEQGERLS
jgi:2-oxo-4-hydroxy-4-carboxy-5-ureidoimidazoline decarboxylase